MSYVCSFYMLWEITEIAAIVKNPGFCLNSFLFFLVLKTKNTLTDNKDKCDWHTEYARTCQACWCQVGGFSIL